MSDLMDQHAPDGKYMIDSYGDWANGEGVPIVTAAEADLLITAVAPWPRFGTKGAIVHLAGRGDFLTLFLFELAPGAKSAQQRHLYEEVFYVLSGRGVTVIDSADGRTSRLAWEAGSLFTVPMNARHHHVNESDQAVRLASVNDLRYLFNVFRNEAFVFANEASFPERVTRSGRRDGARWETEQAIDLTTATIDTESSLDVTLSHGSIGAAVHEIAPRAAPRPGPHTESGCFVFGVSGTITLQQGDAKLDLRPGTVTAVLPDTAYQLSNPATQGARLLAVRMGSARYPLLRTKRNT
jgi:mannose-6-phosphate isomerase-like protein (cupin superfamily)